MIKRKEQIKKLISDYFEDNGTLQKDVYDFVCHNLWHLYNIYDTECHYEDVVDELEELGYNTDIIPKTLIDDIVTSYDNDSRAQTAGFNNLADMATKLRNNLEN